MIKTSIALTKANLPLLSRFSTSHTVEPAFEPYLTYRNPELQKYINWQQGKSFDGHYTQQGAQSFQARHQNVWMKPLISNKNLKVSNIGLGTYKGSLNTSDDILQFNAIIDSVLSGVNVIDTCSNFRGGRSQLVLGAALRYLILQKKYNRSQFFLQSKAGFVREDLPQKLKYEVINDHCIHPTFLQQSLNQSLFKIGIKNLDVFYLNNFTETQMESLKKDQFQSRLAKAFEFMEKSKSEGKIKNYGMASWQSFRADPKHSIHVNLKNIVKIAQKVGGVDHGFRFIQVPINVMMPESFADKNQECGSLIQTAEQLKINIVSCSPLLSGALINIPLPSNKLSCRHNGAKHLQLIRSIPSSALVCSLIGQKTNRHVKKNLQVLEVPCLSEEEWFNLFMPNETANQIPAQ